MQYVVCGSDIQTDAGGLRVEYQCSTPLNPENRSTTLWRRPRDAAINQLKWPPGNHDGQVRHQDVGYLCIARED
jgi:hypothetical protein